jgi:hypothetical protein
MLNNLTNFFNLIVGRRIKTQLEPSDLIAVGTKQSPALGDYKPTAIQFSDLQAQLGGVQSVTGLNTDNTDPSNPIVQISVDGVTVMGLGTPSAPLVSVGNPVIGSLVGGGILVAVWLEGGVNKGLIASLTNLSASLPYTIAAFQTTAIGAAAQSFYNGSTNTSAIIAQTGVPATTAYAAGIARLYLGGGYTDWYLPASWELDMCYASAAAVNKVLGANGFAVSNYWSSTEFITSFAWDQNFRGGAQSNYFKSSVYYVRAVRTHTF